MQMRSSQEKPKLPGRLSSEDARAGTLKSRYRADGFPPLAGMQTPRRDLLNRKSYFFINTVQTTRGCPFDCEFCSVTAFYGRTYRTRPVQDIVQEIEQMDGSHLFFVDDNIVGKPDFAKKLFRALKPLKKKWFSQASLSIVKRSITFETGQGQRLWRPVCRV